MTSIKTERVPQNDVFAAVVPENIDPADPDARAVLIRELDVIARDYVQQQWRGMRRTPISVDHAASQWLITRDRSQVDQFQPDHDCAACRAGNDQARAFLDANPGRWVAMANLHYTEVWPAGGSPR